jgi:hypothetical protein
MHANLQFQIGVGFAVCVAMVTVMMPLADLRYSVQRLCYELSRSDDLILSLPLPEQSVSYARIKRYVQQRKACRFNTNVIIAHEQGTSEIMADSECSDDDPSEDDQQSVNYYPQNTRQASPSHAYNKYYSHTGTDAYYKHCQSRTRETTGCGTR